MAAPEAVQLRGEGRSLSALLRGGEQPFIVPVRLSDDVESFASYRPRAAGLGELRVTLPRELPPGTYETSVPCPYGDQPVVFELQPRPSLSFYPRTLEISGGPNQRVTATIMAFNEGTGGIEIPKSGGVGLWEEEALECALGRAMRADRDPGERLLDRVAEELAGEFGGTMRLGVQTGAGILGPNEARELTLVMHCPAGMKPGKTYGGSWNFDGASLSITVRTASKKEGPAS